MQSKYKCTKQKNILEVFLFFGISSSEQCHVNFTNSLSHCEHIGVPINNGKKKLNAHNHPCYLCYWSRFCMEYRLPCDNLLKIKSMLEVIMCRMKVT